jgi:hypothetical protein
LQKLNARPCRIAQTSTGCAPTWPGRREDTDTTDVLFRSSSRADCVQRFVHNGRLLAMPGSSDHELTCAADGPWPPSFLTFEWHGWGIGTAKRRGLGHSCRSHTLRSTGRFSPKPDTKGLATLAEQQLLNQYRLKRPGFPGGVFN